MNETKIIYLRDVLSRISSVLDFVEAARDNRAICKAIEAKLGLNPVKYPIKGNIYRVILDRADQHIHDLVFTCLMVVMGFPIPIGLYCYHDYSMLCEALGEKGEAWDDE